VHVATLARGLAQRGHRVSIVTTAHPNGILRSEKEGVITYFLPQTNPGRYSHAWGQQCGPFLMSLHRVDPINVIWGEGAGAFYYLKWHRNPLRLPVVSFLQGTYLGELGTSWALARVEGKWKQFACFLPWRTIQYFRWDLWYTRGADAVIGASRENARLARWGYFLPHHRVVASVNGVDVDRFAPNVDAGRQIRARHGISPDAPVLLHCSRLEPEKGAQLSIQAFSLIRRTRHDAQLLVAGDGSQREELRVLANRLGIAEAVHFIGHVGNDDLPAYYNACDVFLYPTLAVESFGIAVAEAMACGRPVVASRRGGIRTSIDHPATGLLVPPGQVEALAHATRSLLADPQARQHMGAAARIKSVEALSVSRMVDDFLAVALRIAGQHLAGNP